MKKVNKTPRILVVNDDGIHGPGLPPLAEALKAVGDVTVLVPEKERSAQSHTLTLHKPLRVRKVRNGFYKVNGSPADCTRLGALSLLKGRVDLIASGINAGYNLGQDVVYSGTIAAAMEGAILRFPSFAISQGLKGKHTDYLPAADFARRIARLILKKKLAPGVCLNVNVPPHISPRTKGAVIACLGDRLYDDRISARQDPIGNKYYWLVGKILPSIQKPGTDVSATERGAISITPLHPDHTHTASLSRLKKWNI